MTKYYSNRPDFNSTVEAGSTNGGYISPTSYNSARSEVIDALSNIDKVTNVILDEHLSYLYVPEGTVKFGQEMPESTFTSSYDTVDRMLDLAKRIHSEVLERIDNKFMKGLEASLKSLNNVNGYETSYLSYTVTHTGVDENGYYYEYETTEHYTLAELLDYKTSPIQATKNFYLQRVSELREQFESTSLEMDEDVKLSLSGGPSYLSNKTDEDLLSMFFEYKQIGDYRGLKYFQWQEDNKAWLEPLEPFLGIGLLAVSLIAAGVSMGAATPAVVASAAAVASTTATAAAVYGAVEGGYGAATGHSLISGTQLSKDDRMWAAAEAISSVATFGIGKAVKLAGAADDIINAVNRTTNAIDDGISLSHIGYDAVVNGKDPTLSMLTFAFGKGAGLAINNVKSNLSNTSTSRSTNTNINVLTKANDSSPWKMNDLEVVHKNYAAKKSDSENEPLSMTEWLERRDIVKQNLTNNNDFSTGSIADLGEMPSFKIKNTELEYQNYVDRKLKSGSEPLPMAEWSKNRDISKQNFSNYEVFSGNRIEEFKLNYNDVETNITVKTHSADGKDQKIRLKAIGVDEEGNIRIQDYTTAKDGLSVKRQDILDNLSKYGGTIVGEGKGRFTGGTKIEPGTRIEIISQKTSNISIEHVSPEIKKATFAKFDELASLETRWNTAEKQAAFKDTFDMYAERAVKEGAVPNKETFYKMYEARQYDYPEVYKEAIKQHYLEGGASSVVNGQSIEDFVFGEKGSSVGRVTQDGIGQGNFTTSIVEDSALLYDKNGALKSGHEIATVKGVGDDTYDTGMFQYEYSPELVKNMDKKGWIQFPNGDTPGSSSLNIPGAKTWAGSNINMSESELLMPSIDMRGHSYDDFLSAIKRQGYYEIKNPRVYEPGTNKVEQVEGIFRINQWSK